MSYNLKRYNNITFVTFKLRQIKYTFKHLKNISELRQ